MVKKISKAILKKREKRLNKRILKEEWRNARLATLERDDFICQKCGKNLFSTNPSGRAIHHVIPRAYKNLFVDLDNLLTLCSSCHHWHKESPHQNALLFAEWFKNKFPERYYYLLRETE